MAKSKKEIDKDLMYKKLMPSNFKASKKKVPKPEPLSEESSSPPIESQPSVDTESPTHTSYRDVSLPSIDSKPTILINRMESAVLERYDSVMNRFHCCKCDRCKKDIIALALNKLPPKYIVLTKGQFVPELDKQTSAQVLTAMIQAVLQVRAHPRH